MISTNILVLLCISLASAADVKFATCAGNELTRVSAPVCNSEYCIVPTGDLVLLSVDFTPNQDTNAVNFTLTAQVGETVIPLPDIETDACKSHVKCPLKAGQKYSLNYSITVRHVTETVNEVVTVRITGDKGVLACGKINCTIIKGVV